MEADRISAEQVMETDPVTASEEESLSQVKNSMEEHGFRALPVTDEKDRLQGVIGYRDLVRFIQFNPETTGLEKVMHQPPEFKETDSLLDLADLRINSGRKMLVSKSGEKLRGVIGDQEFLEVLEDVDELEDVSTERIATFDVITVDEEDSVEKARHMMLDNGISRLPVVDSGKVTGIIDSIDILRMLVPRESQDSGGTSGSRHGTREINISGGGEKESLSGVTADQLMQVNPSTSVEHMTALEAVEKMLERGTQEIVFTDGGYPESIVTLKDLVEYVSKLRQQNTVLVQLTGLEVPEEKSAVHNKIANQLRGSLGRKLRNPEELTLRVKKAEKDGRKHRYEIDLKLYSEYGVTTINEEGWDLLDVVDEALDELNSVIREKHGKRTEHR